MSKAKMQAARELIEAKQYDEARAILKTVDHPTAELWLARIDGLTGGGLPPGVSQAERTAARMKSYNTHVIVVIILYLFLFIPGIIANGLWYQEGKRMEQIAGQPLPGVRALGLMRRWLFILIVVLLVLFVIVIGLPTLRFYI